MIIAESISKNNRGAALVDVLREATKQFDAAGKVRPHARKVLVVIADKDSESRGEDLKKEVFKLQPVGIKVIAVALGEESDKDELDILTPEEGGVIEANNTDGAKKTAHAIMKKALKGKLQSRWEKEKLISLSMY